MIVRPATETDVSAIAEVYAHHVLNGTGTFEEVPPTAEEIGARMGDVATRGLPWFVAEEGGRLIGYAYAGAFRTRAAYKFTAETSVYIADGHQGQALAALC